MAFRKGARARAESAIIIETRGLERCPPLPPARELHIVIAERESRTLRHTHTYIRKCDKRSCVVLFSLVKNSN